MQFWQIKKKKKKERKILPFPDFSCLDSKCHLLHGIANVILCRIGKTHIQDSPASKQQWLSIFTDILSLGTGLIIILQKTPQNSKSAWISPLPPPPPPPKKNLNNLLFILYHFLYCACYRSHNSVFSLLCMLSILQHLPSAYISRTTSFTCHFLY